MNEQRVIRQLEQLAEEYFKVFEERPPLIMLPGSLRAKRSALRRAIKRGSPLRSDELIQVGPDCEI